MTTMLLAPELSAAWRVFELVVLFGAIAFVVVALVLVLSGGKR